MSGGSWEREGRGWASLACPVLLARRREVIVTEVSSSWQGENAWAGQFLAVKQTLGVDFSNVVACMSHANVPLHC